MKGRSHAEFPPGWNDLVGYVSKIAALARQAKSAEALVDGLEGLVMYLKACDEEVAFQIIRLKAGRKGKGSVNKIFDHEGLLTMENDRLKAMLEEGIFGRDALEFVASKRFAMTRSGISNLKSRDALTNKLIVMLRNEGAHDVIARVVASDRAGQGPDKRQEHQEQGSEHQEQGSTKNSGQSRKTGE